jgi:hypothetical protein
LGSISYLSTIQGVLHSPTKTYKECNSLIGLHYNSLIGPHNNYYFFKSKKYIKFHNILAFTHKPNTFHLVMGLSSSWWCFLFLWCKWSGWDSCPFHHRDVDTYATSSHVLIRSQWVNHMPNLRVQHYMSLLTW